MTRKTQSDSSSKKTTEEMMKKLRDSRAKIKLSTNKMAEKLKNK